MMGFLLFNYNPAKIFMGDSGALFAGFALAALSVTGVLKTVTATIILPIFILAPPILDITFSVTRRLSQGKSPFVADAEHIHHKLIKAGFSHNRTVLIFILIAVSAGIIATSFVGAYKLYMLVVLLILPAMLVLAKLSKSSKLNCLQSDISTQPKESK